MPSASQLLAFALLSFVLIIIPGPNVLFVVSRSLMLGRAAGLSTAFGGQVGLYLQVTAVAFGVGALVQQSITLFTVIKLAWSISASRQSAIGATFGPPSNRRSRRNPSAGSCGTDSWSG